MNLLLSSSSGFGTLKEANWEGWSGRPRLLQACTLGHMTQRSLAVRCSDDDLDLALLDGAGERLDQGGGHTGDHPVGDDLAAGRFDRALVEYQR